MRPDVKLGIVVSAVFVMVAGTYFLVQDRRDEAIPVSSDPASMVSDTGKTSASPSKTQPRQRTATPAPSGRRTVNATPKRDRSAQPQKPSGMKTRTPQNGSAGAKRPGTSTLAQRSRSRAGQNSQRRQPIRKQPKPQIALTAAPPNHTGDAIERHHVQEGDTMSSLAKQYYGSTQFAEFLTSWNKHIADPTRLRAGDVINIVPRLPDSGLPKTSKTTAPPKTTTPATREYRIKSGDSFYRIARDVLGDASRWQELYEMNKKLVGGDPTKLQIGQVIALPKK